jgi:HK97 family phage prohead protease
VPDLSKRAQVVDLRPRAYRAAWEVRAKAGSTSTLAGYATVFETPYTIRDWLGEFTETVDVGAAVKTLSDSPDVVFLGNHAGLTMARTKPGTLNLYSDSTGMGVEADVDTRRGDVRDLTLAIERGDVDEMSFAFEVMRQQWSPDYEERRILEFNINRGDVSAVNFGANPATTVATRSDAKRVKRILAAAREGRALEAPDLAVLIQALGWFSAVDSIVDEAQEALATHLGIPNPDADDAEDTAADDAGGVPGAVPPVDQPVSFLTAGKQGMSLRYARALADAS